ncbi:MAG: bacterial transcriptional activator domain-containing protein [Deinococcales bacterium]
MFYLAVKEDNSTWSSREQLADILPLGDIRTTFARARNLAWNQALGSFGLEEEEQLVRWKIETDVKAFFKACAEGDDLAAVNLYSGEFLQGKNLTKVSKLAELREALASSWRKTSFKALQQLERTHRYDLALKLLDALRTHDPWNEELLRYHMRLSYLAGRSEESLLSYSRFCDDLRKENLPYETTVETRHLLEDIKAGRFEAKVGELIMGDLPFLKIALSGGKWNYCSFSFILSRSTADS